MEITKLEVLGKTFLGGPRNRFASRLIKKLAGKVDFWRNMWFSRDLISRSQIQKMRETLSNPAPHPKLANLTAFIVFLNRRIHENTGTDEMPIFEHRLVVYFLEEKLCPSLLQKTSNSDSKEHQTNIKGTFEQGLDNIQALS